MKKEPIFKVLSYREEQMLCEKERLLYFQALRSYVSKRPLTNTTIGARKIAPRLKKYVAKMAVFLTKAFTNKNVDWVCDGTEHIPEGAVIFANTHQGILDNFIWIPEVKKHAILLHSIDTNKLLLLSQYCTGLVLVNKGDMAHRQAAKLDMIRLLLEGHSIIYFPESAWNLSPNKLHLPLNFGFLDIARKAQIPVVPVVHDFIYDVSKPKENIKKIHSRYGKPLWVKEQDDLLTKLEEYQEIISTIRWELMEEKGLFERSSISKKDYVNYIKGNLKNLKFGNIDINMERKCLFHASDEFYLFHHINDIPFDNLGNLLCTEEVQRIEQLNREHGIRYFGG